MFSRLVHFASRFVLVTSFTVLYCNTAGAGLSGLGSFCGQLLKYNLFTGRYTRAKAFDDFLAQTNEHTIFGMIDRLDRILLYPDDWFQPPPQRSIFTWWHRFKKYQPIDSRRRLMNVRNFLSMHVRDAEAISIRGRRNIYNFLFQMLRGRARALHPEIVTSAWTLLAVGPFAGTFLFTIQDPTISVSSPVILSLSGNAVLSYLAAWIGLDLHPFWQRVRNETLALNHMLNLVADFTEDVPDEGFVYAFGSAGPTQGDVVLSKENGEFVLDVIIR